MADKGQLLIPAPSGQYAVGHSTTKLIDNARTDPYDPEHGKRNVMISLFYPVDRSACKMISPVPYMPPKTVEILDEYVAQFEMPRGIFGAIRMQMASDISPEAIKEAIKFPLVLFSPGLGASRLQYNALAQKLASAGYAVVTMDYTYETIVVEYPDGTYTPGLPPTHWDPSNREKHEAALATRVEDSRFVLSQLGSLDVVQQLVPGATAPFNTEKAVFIGHSFGGCTAISALMADARFAGAVNMDGSQYGPLSDTQKPVLLFGRGDPSPRNRSNNATWEPLWAHLKGRRKEVNLRGCEHTTFCDTPLLTKLSGMPTSGIVEKMIGTLDGERSFEVVARYLVEFAGFVLKGEEGLLFAGPREEWPEIVFGEN
ncbi:PAF acetylhydrolase family protein [Trematosphaeria pertusa]|uniref:1-alkyl-2-acetylglycerophosphocholine esterase n=1 Tax=Trematosphaeria pertusa TaxID=390896 RepID=A0A6A6HUV6_9PLEO|nr:PAF acetylhydrolase family protein [Trematosphaeria pertusa]KAF2241791.1 PAF acetylhydrolase family protein [Trematosphaeria pertusa]